MSDVEVYATVPRSQLGAVLTEGKAEAREGGGLVTRQKKKRVF